MTTVVGADIALEAALVISPQHIDDPGVAVTISVAGLTEVAVFEVLDITDVGKGDAVAMLTPSSASAASRG